MGPLLVTDTCGNCRARLGRKSVSLDFCSPHCQAQWHARLAAPPATLWLEPAATIAETFTGQWTSAWVVYTIAALNRAASAANGTTRS